MNGDASALLHALGEDGYMSVCHQRPGGRFEFRVQLLPAALSTITAIGKTACLWYSVGRMAEPPASGRGKAEDVTRLTCLYADLDYDKTPNPAAVIDGLPDHEFIIESGHGEQPIWPVTGPEFTIGSPEDRERVAALLRRWGRMIARRAGTLDGKTDSVYDLARVLRVPGTVNHKDPRKPVPARLKYGRGTALTWDQVVKVLDEEEQTAPTAAGYPFQQPFQRDTTYTNPDPDALVTGGIQEGSQDNQLRDLVFDWVRAGLGKAAIRGLWDEVVARTPLTKPGQWTDADFERHYRGAVRKARPDAAESAESGAGDSADSGDSAAWERPAPLGGHALLPQFPLDAFPRWLGDQARALAEFTQTPSDISAGAGLGVLSTAAGGRAVVNVRGGWQEPVNLYIVGALPPGARKSAVFSAMTSPVEAAEKQLADKAAPGIVQAATERKVAQKNAERLAAAASQKDTKPAALAEAIDAAQYAESIIVPAIPQLIADDVTPEAATSLLAEQGGRLAVLSAEGGIFGTLAGRYSGGVPSFEVFLKGHSGDALRVDRKGRPPERIPHPALTLALCVQPDVLRDIAGMPGFRGRGLLARILYSVPVNLVGRRRTGTAQVPEQVNATYERNVQALVWTFADLAEPAILTLSAEAAKVLLAAEEAIEPRLAPDTGDLAGITDWASKQIGATVRIAGLLHLASHLDDGWGEPVSGETMRNALRIGDYYTAHALAAFDHMGVDQGTEDARVILTWLERTRPARFTKRELFSGVSRSRFPKVGDLDAPLYLLEQHGYIRRGQEQKQAGPGRRSSPAYEVHPDLAAETAETAETQP